MAIIGVSVLTLTIFSTLYICNVNFLTNIIVVSENHFKILVSTPLNKQIDFPENNDTLIIPKRPIKSILIINKEIQCEINSVIELNEFTQKNEYVDIILENQDVSIFDVYSWYLKAHPIFLDIIFLLAGLTIVLIIFIYRDFIFKIWRRIKLKFYWRRIKYKFYRFLLKNNGSPKTKLHPIKLNSFNKYLLIALCIIILPILYTHLDRPYSYISEEKRRALVAFEMRMQNSYLVPTLVGEQYCNKPPVFNWIIAPFIKMNKVEAVTRSISVSLIILCAIALFFLIRKGTNWQHALLTSFLFLSSGFILIYLSLFLYIEGLFVLLLILMLYSNFYLINKEKYLQAFIIGYFLCALAFLTKGFPALWVQFVSIFSVLLINKKLKVLYSYKHFVGIFIFLIITGSYFYLYFLKTNSISMLTGLFGEITEKVGFTSIAETSLHKIAFLAAAFVPYAPIGLLLPLLFYRGNLMFIMKDKKLSYFFINLFVGISIFLTSDFFLPYYILMYIPFFIELILYLIKPFSLLKKKNLWFFVVLGVLLVLLFEMYNLLGFYWVNIQNPIITFVTMYFILLIFLIAFFRKNIISILLFVCLSFMGVRVCDNTINNVIMLEEPLVTNTKVACENIAKKNHNKKFYIFSSKSAINSAPIFYLSYYLNSMILFYDKCENYDNSLLIIDKCSLWDNQLIIDSIPQMSKITDKYEFNQLYIIEFDKSIANKCDGFNAIRCLK